MSTHQKNTTARPAAPTPGSAPDAAAAAPDGGSRAAGVPVLRNDSDAALWAALGAHPGSTTAALADVAGVGLSTARRALSIWESKGTAHSHRYPESPRAAKTWTTAEPAEPAAPETATTPEPPAAQQIAPAEVDATNTDPSASTDPASTAPGQTATTVTAPTGDSDPAPTPNIPKGDEDAPATQRLRSGALRGQVEDFLRDHPDADFSPHQIGKALDRSSGAVHNALVTLTKGGTAHQTSTAPKRFAVASTEEPHRSGNPGHQPQTPAN